MALAFLSDQLINTHQLNLQAGTLKHKRLIYHTLNKIIQKVHLIFPNKLLIDPDL